MQANRLINVARRMQKMSSITDVAKKKCNEGYNTDTLDAYFKEAARMMKPSKGIEDKKVRDEERKDGGEKLMKEMLALDPKNPIHAAKAIRAAEKHKAIACKWRHQAQAEERRKAKEEHVDPRKGLKVVANKISSLLKRFLHRTAQYDKASVAFAFREFQMLKAKAQSAK